MAVGVGAQDFEGVAGGDEGFAAQGAADHLDERAGQMGEVAEGLVLDLAALAIGLAQQMGLVNAALIPASRGNDMDGTAAASPITEDCGFE